MVFILGRQRGRTLIRHLFPIDLFPKWWQNMDTVSLLHIAFYSNKNNRKNWKQLEEHVEWYRINKCLMTCVAKWSLEVNTFIFVFIFVWLNHYISINSRMPCTKPCHNLMFNALHVADNKGWNMFSLSSYFYISIVQDYPIQINVINE